MTLDPNSPDYKWEEGGIVASSDGIEDCNAIDPGVFLDPTDGRLWLTYGSYFGFIRLVELDLQTGKRRNPNDQPLDIAINCEASDMIYHDGWYYLLATHGSCCAGANSGYNIRVGRARTVSGPFLDHTGLEMLKGGGKLFVGSGGRVVGPGHFGLLDLGDGVQKFSCHYEADLDRGGASVLDIRPLLWKNGWPVAGDNFKEGTYEIESVRTGTALELAVEGVPVGGGRARGARGGPGGGRGAPVAGPIRPGGPGGGGGFGGRGGGVPIPPQDAAQVSTNWPAGNINVRLANYMVQAQQNIQVGDDSLVRLGRGGMFQQVRFGPEIAPDELQFIPGEVSQHQAQGFPHVLQPPPGILAQLAGRAPGSDARAVGSPLPCTSRPWPPAACGSSWPTETPPAPSAA
jgi:arabinan endo-1,5-alpha-L-arabinosidase